MEMELDLKIESYLDGTLGPEETRSFEAELTRPEVAHAFSQALLIRTTFRAPVDMPDDLADRVADAIGAAAAEDLKAGSEEGRSTVKAVLESFGWIFRGPALAVGSSGQAGSGAMAGLGTVRYAMAPVDVLRTSRPKKPRTTLKRRLFNRLLRKLK